MKINLHVKPNKEVIERCMLLSNHIILDEMPDNSFIREKSDKGIHYVFENIDKIILFKVAIDNESFMMTRCVNIEIRDKENYITYLLTMEFSEANIDALIAAVQEE